MRLNRLIKVQAGWSVMYFIAALMVLCMTGHIDASEQDRINSLAGPEFTDMKEVLEMPREWVERPIVYDPSAAGADLVVTLDQHLYPALVPLIEAYGKEHKLKIVVNEGTCGISAGMLSRKSADIGGFCCPPGLIDRIPGLVYHTLGISSLALFVHTDNEIESITIEDARRIFAGDIYRWSEIEGPGGKAGPNLPVQPVGRLHCKLRPGHWRLLLDNQDQFSAGLQEVGAIPDMISKVASNQRAIGYEVLWNAVRYNDRGKVKAIKINGVSPFDRESLLAGDYPLYRVYNLSTWTGEGVENREADRLVEYLLKQSDTIDGKHHIIPVQELKKAGWKFGGNELIGEPK